MKKKGIVAAILFVSLFSLLYLVKKSQEEPPFQQNEGKIFGTTYHITYAHNGDLQAQIDSTLKQFDASLSPFNPNSVISQVNTNRDVQLDDWFTQVFNRSKNIYTLSGGAFDPTASPLINAWGFGFSQKDSITPAMIDSLLPLVGMDKIELTHGKIVKADPRMTLNFSAIAKGYAVDVIANLLRENEVDNFMVEIGGEIVASGKNQDGNPWRIGVSKPLEKEASGVDDLDEILSLTDVALATSGNYRNYYYKDGKRVAHTIDPATGYPAEHSLLSATVIAPDCMTADAFATSFMVMGLEKSQALANSITEIDAYFIYTDKNDSLRCVFTPGMKKYLSKTIK